MRCEPGLKPERIIVVDDGARAGAESLLPDVTWIEGKKPFCYARNCNLALSEIEGDAILLNDDAILQTPGGFSAMSQASEGWGILGPITNSSGNPNQLHHYHDGMVHDEPSRCLPFICAYITANTLHKVGLLDETFDAYGYEDMDLCRRTRMAGLKVGIFDGCFVDHLSLKSTFANSEFGRNCAPGQAQYLRKWGTLEA